MAAKPPGKGAAQPSGNDPGASPEQLMAQLGMLQREMERMDRRMAALESALMEAQEAASTVQALTEANGDVEALVPLGGGVHVRARLDAGAPVLLPIGAGYLTESGPAQVAEALRARVEALTDQFRQASQEAERVAQAAQAVNAELGGMQG